MIITRFNTRFKTPQRAAQYYILHHYLSSLIESVGIDDGSDGLLSLKIIFEGLSEDMTAMDGSSFAAFAACKAASHV